MLQSTNTFIAGLGAFGPCFSQNCTRLAVRKGRTVYAADQEIDHVYLIVNGLFGLTWPAAAGAITLALIGAEGMLGSLTALGDRTALFDAVSLTEATLLAVPIDVFDEALRQSPELRSEVAHFDKALVRQIAGTAHANARLKIEHRLARWIELASDRISSPAIAVTHDALATAIGCRRAGVTVALHILEGEKVIRSKRGRISVLDPDRLSSFAKGEVGAASFPGKIGA
jgi:CRP-like cAMP-binding protein